MYFKLLKNKQKTKENPVLKNKKTQEKSRGRSMVEMLGVLAIIGVLSIGGIQGYTIAMRRHQANEILNVANKYATIIWTQYQQEILNGEYLWYGVDGSTYADMTEDRAKEYIGSSAYRRDDKFENAGLGNKPTGLLEIHHDGIWAGKSGVGVAIFFTFESQALCETVKSMTDANEDMYYNCGESRESLGVDADKKLSLYFYQK